MSPSPLSYPRRRSRSLQVSDTIAAARSVYKYLPHGVQREDQPERKHYALDVVPGVTEQRRRILGWPEEWGGEEGQLTGAGLMFEPPKL